MSNITSKELETAQRVLETLIHIEVDAAVTNYSRVRRLLTTAKEVDTLRRETWHEEKFGAYEALAGQVLEADFNQNKGQDFTADDIPF